MLLYICAALPVGIHFQILCSVIFDSRTIRQDGGCSYYLCNKLKSPLGSSWGSCWAPMTGKPLCMRLSSPGNCRNTNPFPSFQQWSLFFKWPFLMAENCRVRISRRSLCFKTHRHSLISRPLKQCVMPRRARPICSRSSRSSVTQQGLLGKSKQ